MNKQHVRIKMLLKQLIHYLKGVRVKEGQHNGEC